MMNAFLGIVILSVCIVFTAHASQFNDEQRAELHNVSQNLADHVDYNALVEQHFIKFKERVFVSNQELSEKERNQKIRVYLKDYYFPRLVFNYGVIYQKLIKAGREFSPLDKPEAILHRFYDDEYYKDLPQMSEEMASELALSAGVKDNKLIVEYYARRGWDEYWPDPYVVYTFERKENNLVLTDIKLNQNTFIKQFIPGV
ncbi:MAG: hypothetical protein JXR16_16680 [Bermanella sp.]